jgi:uncharacterized protein (TIGR01244 family)
MWFCLPAAALAFALVAGPLPAQAQSSPAAPPSNLVTWRAGLVSSAQPSRAYLAQVREQGYDVVINLAPPPSSGSIDTEGAIVGAQGVTYVNIPVDFGEPTAADFAFFSAVMQASAGKNVLVHCQVNLRGSSFVFLYRAIHEGAPVAETMRKLTGVWMPSDIWRRFIEAALARAGKPAEIL